MLKRILIFLVLCLGVQTLAAQDLVDCTYQLEDAREAYNAGMVELVPELLLGCVQSNGLSGEARKEAYKLVINSYLYDYQPEEADSLMTVFVIEYPEYRAESSDPQEFVFLLDAHLIALGINPDQPVEDSISTAGSEGDEKSSRRIITKGAGEYGNTLGFSVGASLNLPSVLEAYSLGDPALDESRFGILPGFLVGVETNLILSRKLEISIGLHFDLTRFSYFSTPLPSTSYQYVELQQQILLPLSFTYKFNPENRKICYYMRIGVAPNYLFYASGSGTRTFEDSQDDLLVDNTDITESRVKFNLNGLFGLGIRIPLKKAFIFTEARLSSRIFQANLEEDRYGNNDLTWMLYHVDSDFLVHQLSVCVGICWDLKKE